MAEIIEPMETVLQKAKTIAGWIKESKHFIAFTGAGISTSTGIPDFRGPQGVWTMRDKGVAVPRGNTLNKIPTPAHMALVQFSRQGTLKYLVSQNTDGLHRRSGFVPEDFSTRGPSASNHVTGRQCNVCGGILKDTIINFGENLPTIPLDRAFKNAELADLCLVLGSSLKVTPAADIPKKVAKNRKARLVICNLQPTPLDDKAALVVHAKTDDLMQAICAELDVQIPPFVLERRLQILSTCNDKQLTVTIKGYDVDGTPASFLQAVKVDLTSYCQPQSVVLDSEPYTASAIMFPAKTVEPCKATLQFMGWYNEPNLELSFSISREAKYVLFYQPSTGAWQKQRVP